MWVFCRTSSIYVEIIQKIFMFVSAARQADQPITKLCWLVIQVDEPFRLGMTYPCWLDNFFNTVVERLCMHMLYDHVQLAASVLTVSNIDFTGIIHHIVTHSTSVLHGCMSLTVS